MANIINFGGGSSELNGTAVAADVLANKTFYNTDPDTVIKGTMPNNGAVSNTETIASLGGTSTYTIPKGYHDGTGTSVITAPSLAALSSPASASDILSGKQAYNSSGGVITGSYVKDITGSSRTTLTNRDRTNINGTYQWTASQRGIYVAAFSRREMRMSAYINGVSKPVLVVDHYNYIGHCALLVNAGDVVKFVLSGSRDRGDLIISFYAL